MALPFNPAQGITITDLPQKDDKPRPCDIEECSNPATKEIVMPFFRQWRLPRFLDTKVCDAHARWLGAINAETGNRSGAWANQPP